MYDEILFRLHEPSDKQLNHLIVEVEELQKSRNNYTVIYLQYNQYGGSRECWVAEVDQITGKIVSYLNLEKHIVKGENGKEGEKAFRLQEGKYYLINSRGTNIEQDTVYCLVKDGDLTLFNPLQ